MTAFINDTRIEDNERSINAKKKEEFEAEKQDQSDTSKYLQDMKEHEMQEVRVFNISFTLILIHL